MKDWKNKRDFLLEVEVPKKIGRYCPIPHSVFLNEIQEELYKQDYVVVEERYLSTNNGMIMSGNMRVQYSDDLEMAPAISFINSYNKMRKAEIRASALVLVCKNGMMADVEDGFYSRKHIGEHALTDFRKHIILVVAGLQKEFERLLQNREEMKRIELDKKTKALLIGDMLLNEELLTMTQFTLFKEEMLNSASFKGQSLWDFYNWVTMAYHDNHPSLYDKQHVFFNSYVGSKFNLTGNKGLYGRI